MPPVQWSLFDEPDAASARDPRDARDARASGAVPGATAGGAADPHGALLEDDGAAHDLPEDEVDLHEPLTPPRRTPAGVPYRLDPIEAPRAVIVARNAVERRVGAAQFAPEVELEEARALRAKSAAVTRLRGWIFHPDERVPLALVDNRQDPRPWASDEAYAKDSLYQRAMADAAAGGHLWTPLLDAMAVGGSGAWPIHGGDPRTWASEPRDVPAPVPYADPDALAARLAPWLASQQDPAVVAPLLEFAYHVLHQVVARHAACLSPGFVAQVLERSALAEAIAQNPALTADGAAVVVAWALHHLRPDAHPGAGDPPRAAGDRTPAGAAAAERLARTYRALGVDATDEASRATRAQARLLRGFEAREPRSPWAPPAPGASAARVDPMHCKDALLALHARFPLPEEALAQLAGGVVAVADKKRAGSLQMNSPRANCLATLLELDPPVAARWLHELLPPVQHEADAVVRLVCHAAADDELRRRAATLTTDSKVRETLASERAWRADPVVRRALAKSDGAGVLECLCREAEGEEFRTLFTRLLKKDASRAAGLLLDPALPGQRALRVADVRALVERDDWTGVTAWFALRHLTLADKSPDTDGYGYGEEEVRRRFPRWVRARGETDASLACRAIGAWSHEVQDLLAPADLLPMLERQSGFGRFEAFRFIQHLRCRVAPGADPADAGFGEAYVRAHLPAAFRELAAASPQLALQQLEQFPDALLPFLTRVDFLPLLKSTVPEYRKAAMMAVRRLPGAPLAGGALAALEAAEAEAAEAAEAAASDRATPAPDAADGRAPGLRYARPRATR